MGHSVSGIRALRGLCAVVLMACFVGNQGCTGDDFIPVTRDAGVRGRMLEIRAECMHGKVAQCEYLTTVYRDGLGGFSRDQASARDDFRIACDGGSLKGCDELMNFVISVTGWDEPAETRISTIAEQEALLKTCLKGNPEVCEYLMKTWSNEDVYPTVDECLLPMLDMVCDVEESVFCAEAAFMVEKYERLTAAGTAPGTCAVKDSSGQPARQVSSTSMWARACGDSDRFACLWGGGSKALPAVLPVDIEAERVHFEAIRTTQLERAEKYHEPWDGIIDDASFERGWLSRESLDAAPVAGLDTGCRHGRGSDCLEAGMRLFANPSIPFDPEKIKTLWSRGCSLGRPAACRVKKLIAAGAGFIPDKVQVCRVLSDLCDGGDAEACFLAGICGADWLPGVGSGRADFLTTDSCDRGFGRACLDDTFSDTFREWKMQPGIEDLGSDAWDFLDRDILEGCDAGIADACTWIGWVLCRKGYAYPDVIPWGADVYLEKACRLGDGAACYKRGVLADGYDPATLDEASARKFYAAACDAGHGLGCARLGVMLREGTGGAVSPGPARKFFARACDSGNGDACAALSEMLEKGEGGAVNMDGAFAMARRASLLSEMLECDELPTRNVWDLRDSSDDDVTYCSSGDEVRNCYMACLRGVGDACTIIASAWDIQVKNEKCRDSALMVSAKGCEQGFGESCEHNAYLQYQTEPVEERTPLASRVMFEKACAMGRAEACHLLNETVGESVDEQEAARRDALIRTRCLGGVAAVCGPAGKSVLAKGDDPRRQAMARSLFGIGCNRGDDGSCVGLALMYKHGDGGPGDVRLAAEILDGACKNLYGPGCFELGNMWREGLIPGDESQAMAVWYDGCEYDDAQSCVEWGRQARIESDYDLAVRGEAHDAFDKACRSGNAEGCLESGLVYRDGNPGDQQDYNSAAVMFGRACEMELVEACREQGEEILGDEPSPAARAVAMAALEKGCSMNDGPSCNLYGYFEVAAGTGDGVEHFTKGCFMADGPSSGAACFNLATKRTDADQAPIDRLYARACESGVHAGCRMKAVGLLKTNRAEAAAWLATAGLQGSLLFSCEHGDVPDCIGMMKWMEEIGNASGRDQILAAMEEGTRTECETESESCRTLGLVRD